MGGPGMAFGGMPMGGMHFGGGPGMAFYVNGVPARARGGAPPQPMEMPQIEVPPFVEALIKTVPPPLLVLGALAFVMLMMQLVSALMQFLMPVMFPLLLVNNFGGAQNLRAQPMLGPAATSPRVASFREAMETRARKTERRARAGGPRARIRDRKRRRAPGQLEGEQLLFERVQTPAPAPTSKEMRAAVAGGAPRL